MPRPVLIVHGGAGRRDTARREQQSRGMAGALHRGWEVLRHGGTALDAVVEAVAALEDDPHFNAGHGSVLTAAGTVEMDASLMDGAFLAAGAVGAVAGVRHPIRVARSVLDHGEHVFLVAEGARRWAEERGLELCAPADLVTERQRSRWEESRSGDDRGGNTVGAVALDLGGHLAAATSTGGVSGKRPGRIGDSAVIGAGTYADDRAGAASATGRGEHIIRTTVTRRAVDLLRGGCEPQQAAEQLLRETVSTTGGNLGLVVLDPFGRLGRAYDTEYMPTAWLHPHLDGPAIEV